MLAVAHQPIDQRFLDTNFLRSKYQNGKRAADIAWDHLQGSEMSDQIYNVFQACPFEPNHSRHVTVENLRNEPAETSLIDVVQRVALAALGAALGIALLTCTIKAFQSLDIKYKYQDYQVLLIIMGGFASLAGGLGLFGAAACATDCALKAWDQYKNPNRDLIYRTQRLNACIAYLAQHQATFDAIIQQLGIEMTKYVDLAQGKPNYERTHVYQPRIDELNFAIDQFTQFTVHYAHPPEPQAHF